DRVRVLPDEAVHVHARVEFQDARLVVRVLPHFLEGAAPAVLGPVAVVQARLGVPAAEEDDPLGPFPAPASDRPDVAGERVFLQIEEELLERGGTASRGADEFTLWQEEVLGRMAPSVATAHSRGSSKKVPTQVPRLRTGGAWRDGRCATCDPKGLLCSGVLRPMPRPRNF